MDIKSAIKELRNSKKRNFSQTFDLIINLKNIDLKRPENRITKQIVLPHGKGKEVKVGIFSDNLSGDNVITSDDLKKLAKSKKDAKKLVRDYDFFIAEAPMMLTVGKVLGRYLGPLGKMPKPFPPGAKIEKILEDLKKTVQVKVKDSPNIQCPVGSESMKDEEIEENIRHLFDQVVSFLPKKRAQVKDVRLKLTMSKPIKIEIK